MKNPTLLLVDDEPAVLSSLRRVFRGCGYRILVAESADSALSLLGAERIDVILSDHRMPGRTGVEFLRDARRRAPGAFRILLSAYVDSDLILSASHEGVVERFIEKPFQDDEVRAVVEEFLERREVRERRDFLEALLEGSPDPILICDLGGAITYLNAPAGEFLGDPREKILGRNITETFAGGPMAIEAVRALLRRDGRVLGHETQALTRRGPVTMSLSIAPLLDAEGRRQGFLGIGKDISAQKKAEAELRRRNQELAAINRFAGAALGRPGPEQIVDRAMDALGEVACVDAAALFVREPGDEGFRLCAQRGLPEPLAAGIAANPHPFRPRPAPPALIIGACDSLPGIPEGEAFAREGFGACAYTSVVWNGEVNAILVVARRGPGSLDATLERLLPAIGAMAGTSMENSVLFARTQAEAQRSALLHGIAGAAQHSLDVEHVLDRTLDGTARALGVERAVVALFREDLSGLETCRSLDGPTGPAEWRDLGIGAACLSHDRADGALVVPDATRDSPVAACLPSTFRRGLGAFVEVPLVYQDGLLGVLQVGTTSPRRWKREEVHLLEGVALELALAVRHARTVRELRRALEDLGSAKSAAERRAEETSALYRLARSLTHLRDFDELLALTAESVLAATHARAAGAILTGSGRVHAALLACGDVKDSETRALRAAIIEAGSAMLGTSVRELERAPIRIAGACGPTASEPRTEGAQIAPDLILPLCLANQEAGFLWIRPHGRQPFDPWEKDLARTIALQASSTLERLLDTLAAERRKIQAMVEGMSEPVVLLDESHALLCMNGAARRLLDLDDPRARFDPARLQPLSLRRLFLRAARRSDAAPLEEDVAFARPRSRVYHVTLSPVFDSAGRRMGTAALFHDVTARREVEEMKSEFVANVSHELRTPLTSIKESIALLLDGVVGTLAAGQREFLEMAERETNRLVRLVNDVLEFSRIESSRIHLKRSPVCPRELAESVIASFGIVAERAGVPLSLDAPERIPPLLADPDRVTQILLILLDNAIKFTSPGGSVTVSVSGGPDAVVIRVADTGCGIPEAELEQIFETFHQVPRTEEARPKGTGLGLSIAKRLAELHRGTIRAESRPGEGSTFTLTLPRLEASAAVEEYLEGVIIRARGEEQGVGLISLDLRARGNGGIGEAVQARVVEALRKGLYRPADRIFVHGPRRVLLVLDRIGAAGVHAARERLARALGEAMEGVPGGFAATWAVAAYPEDGITPAELLGAAGATPPPGGSGPGGSSPPAHLPKN